MPASGCGRIGLPFAEARTKRARSEELHTFEKARAALNERIAKGCGHSLMWELRPVGFMSCLERERPAFVGQNISASTSAFAVETPLPFEAVHRPEPLSCKRVIREEERTRRP